MRKFTTVGVNSLYTNIKQKDGINAVRRSLERKLGSIVNRGNFSRRP